MTEMIDWGRLTLFMYITMRMTGFVVINPMLGRKNIPGMVKAGMSLLLAATVYAASTGAVMVPATVLELGVRLVLELSMGVIVALIMGIFFYIPELAGDMVDMQMGMSMAKTYDAGTQSSMTVTASLLNALMILLFFAANGHHTLLRIMITSGELVPYGAVSLGNDVVSCVLELFITCTLLAVKLCLPILAAELMGQVGMGILMKVIPQINIFAINIELKVIIGLTLILLFLSPFSEFLLDAEMLMLNEIRRTLSFMG